MNVFDRLLMNVLFIFLGFIAAITVLLGIGYISLEQINDLLARTLAIHRENNLLYIIAIIMILVALRLLVIGVSRSVYFDTIDKKTEFGNINITLSTIENLTRDLTKKVNGVKDLEVKVKALEGGNMIGIKLTTDANRPMEEMSLEIQSKVKEHIEHIAGIPIHQVNVLIAGIAHDAPIVATKTRRLE